MTTPDYDGMTEAQKAHQKRVEESEAKRRKLAGKPSEEPAQMVMDDSEKTPEEEAS